MHAKLVPDPTTRLKKKICNVCGEEKQIEKFHRERGKVDGRKNACAECTNRAKTEWARKNKKHINAYRRRRYRRRRFPSEPVLQTGDASKNH
jgi:hypothetical protein